MENPVRPGFPTELVGSAQATAAAVKNSALLEPCPKFPLLALFKFAEPLLTCMLIGQLRFG